MALTADAILPILEGEYAEHPVLNATKIYEGAVVSITAAGYAKGYAGTDTIFAGIAAKQADNSAGAAGAINVKVRRDPHFRQVTLASVAQSDVGTAVYASDDATFTLTAGSNLLVGVVHEYVTTNTCIVKLMPETFDNVAGSVATAEIAAGAVTPPKMAFTGEKMLTADGANASGGDQNVTLTGAAVGDRVRFIWGVVKADHAGAWLLPTIGTHFEATISVVNQIVQKTASGDLSANTYLFVLEPAAA